MWPCAASAPHPPAYKHPVHQSLIFVPAVTVRAWSGCIRRKPLARPHACEHAETSRQGRRWASGALAVRGGSKPSRGLHSNVRDHDRDHRSLAYHAQPLAPCFAYKRGEQGKEGSGVKDGSAAAGDFDGTVRLALLRTCFSERYGSHIPR